MILQEGDHLYYETTAVAKLITTLSSEKWLGILLRVTPLPIRNLGYRLFANNRDGKHIGINPTHMKNHSLLMMIDNK